ncbi:hypothetical protein [Phenylobacterium sp.]|uniref:DUF6894 family protein n=1 Tax=Phenylobacterium sp. TaxID=1871053 RepID=UPI0035AE1C97
MPRFYFHLVNRIGASPDEDGRELPDLATARQAAIDDIRSILSDDVKTGVLDLCGRIEIADEADLRTAVPFAEAIELKLPDLRA